MNFGQNSASIGGNFMGMGGQMSAQQSQGKDGSQTSEVNTNFMGMDLNMKAKQGPNGEAQVETNFMGMNMNMSGNPNGPIPMAGANMGFDPSKMNMGF